MSIRMRFRKPEVAAVLLLAATALAGCGRDAVGPRGRVGQVGITVDLPQGFQTVGGITVEVTGTPLAGDTIWVNLTDSGGGLWQGSVDVPVGNGYTFKASAYEDTDGTLIYQGEVTGQTVTVAGPNTITLLLSILVGSVDIDGTVGSYIIVLDTTGLSGTLDSAIVSIGSGALTVNATLEDQDSVGVGGTVDWAILNPGVASLSAGTNTVDITGLVSGEVTRLVATYKGFTAVVPVHIHP